MSTIKWTITLLAAFMLMETTMAHVGPTRDNNRQRSASLRFDCAPSTDEKDLAINNVRARLINAGELFTSMGDGRYIVPNRDPGSGLDEVSSLYAAAVWIGGFQENEDGDNVLRMAAQTFRQGDNVDFWPGPLTPDGGTTNAQTCRDWDLFFRVRGESIRQHLDNVERFRAQGLPYPASEIPEDLRRWPARGNPYFNEFYDFELPDVRDLGSFYDDPNGTLGQYDPADGDYPVIEIRGCEDPQFADDMYFWIYNDNGNIHLITRSEPIRMEVQVQAFAYATQDEVNNMTFYRYKLINRASETIDSTFFAMWLDPDLGCPDDDYIGCDTSRSLMYVYNEDAVDGVNGCDCVVGEIIPTYCNEVPILGVDYFRGPEAPVFDANGVPIGFQELGMSSFTYYNREGPPAGQTDPQVAAEFYNYLVGYWRDGSPFEFGGDGYQEGTFPIRYAFTDPPNLGGGWSMCEEQLRQGDRRTLQATGPLELLPGVTNELIIGVVWLPDANYPCPSVEPLFSADERAQALFDNCFDILDGPESPLVSVLELDRELVFTVDELDLNYEEVDPTLPDDSEVEDSVYVFEGFRVFQLRNAEVEPVAASFADPELAREIAQFDLRNGIRTLFNWGPIDNPNDTEPIFVPTLQVSGADEGLQNTFSVTRDEFAAGEDNRLINFTEYYFAIVAYGTNNYEPFNVNTNEGQRLTYLISRNGQSSQVNGTPRPTAHLELNSMYGEGLQVTRLDGYGVLNNNLNITEETRDLILANNEVDEITYELGMSPLNAKIYDPVNILDGSYTLTFEPYADDPGLEMARFIVTRDGTGESDTSDFPISVLTETILTDFGFSVRFAQDVEPGTDPFNDPTNGFLGSAIEYADPRGPEWYNFIPEGITQAVNFHKTEVRDELDFDLDPSQIYSTQVATGFYPFVLNAHDTLGLSSSLEESGGLLFSPAWFNQRAGQIKGDVDGLSNISNVDIVFTSNKDLWSRCVVVQGSNYFWESQTDDPNSRRSMDLILKPSVGKDAVDTMPNVAAPLNDGTVGLSYFPGYAIDVETGRRLNIFFSENTALYPENLDNLNAYLNETFQTGGGATFLNNPALLTGGDMIWNPNASNSFGGANQFGVENNFLAGNQHYIFVTDQTYDGCEELHDLLFEASQQTQNIQREIRQVRAYRSITWAGFPLLAPDQSLLSYADGLIPNDVTISMRVKNPFALAEETGLNGGVNQYRILVDGKQPDTRVAGEALDTRLDLINVVPNPYYAYSRYELQATDNVVKITNLPQVCTVTIYSLDGRFIRQYDRNVEGNNSRPNPNEPIPDGLFPTDIEWDLKNSQGILVSSGVYYIHVEAPGLGERVLKWFGVNRKFDPSAIN